MKTKQLVLVTVAVAMGIAAPVSAQIDQGDLVYIEGENGELELFRRIDRAGELDNRAHFARVPAEEQQAVVQIETAQVIPVVERSAVIQRTSSEATTSDPTVVVVEPVAADETTVVQAETVEEERDLVRLRIGATAHGGYTLGDTLDDPEGWMAGLSLRIGAQISDWFAAYYQPAGFFVGLESATPGDDFEDAWTMWNTFLAEVTLFDFLSIGGGPSVDFFWGCDGSRLGQASCSDEGAFFGLHGRAAVNLGGMLFDQRGAVNLSFDIHPTWFEDDSATLAMLGGIGVELY